MRRAADLAFRLGTAVCALAAVGLLAGIGAVVLSRALPALDLALLLDAATSHTAPGELVYQTLGTIILVLTALVVSVPMATGLALAQSVYLGSRSARRLRLALYVANGVPSIAFGILGLMVFSGLFGWGKSWLAGGIILALMILPTLTVALVERIEAIPDKYSLAARGLGLTRSQVVRSVLLPLSRGGLVAGAFLGLARAAGETAPIMFTAAVFSGATLPHGWRDSPVLALPYHIFVLAQDTYDPRAHAQLWAAALVLLALVLTLSLLSLPVRLRASEEASHG